MTLTWESFTVTLALGTVHYVVMGPQTGRLVVCCHGFGLCHTQWQRVAERLAKCGRQVIALDFYGSGYSSRGHRDVPMTRELFCQQLHELLDYLNVKDNGVDLLGFSMGGGVAMEYTARNPSRVGKLLLLAPVGFQESNSKRHHVFSFIGNHLANFLTSRVGDHVIDICSHAVNLLNDMMGLSEPDVKTLYDALSKEHHSWNPLNMSRVSHSFKQMYFLITAQLYYMFYDSEYFRAQMKILRDGDLLGFSPENIRSAGKDRDVMLMWGKLDQLLHHSTELTVNVRRLLPFARYIEIEDAGHGMICEKPTVVENHIIDFLDCSLIDSKHKSYYSGISPNNRHEFPDDAYFHSDGAAETSQLGSLYSRSLTCISELARKMIIPNKSHISSLLCSFTSWY